jgi:hypothetical protein
VLLQPHKHHLDKASFETLTSVTNFNLHRSSAQLRRPTRDSSFSKPPEHNPTLPTQLRSRRVLEQHYVYHASNLSLPPLRDLPPLYTAHEEVHWLHTPLEADQFVEGPFEEEMIPAGLDLSLGRLYGFPYFMGVSNAIE